MDISILSNVILLFSANVYIIQKNNKIFDIIFKQKYNIVVVLEV